MYKANKFFTGILILLLCGLCFCACGSAPPPQAAGSGGSRSSAEPAWLKNPGSFYPDSQYVVATGDGKNLEEAQYKARANLLGIFGMKLSDESVIAEMFQSTETARGVNWTDTVTSDRRISSSAEGILSGCEIKENWNNARGNQFYALAVMDKARTISIYTDIIARLSQNIADLINIPNINSIDGYSRLRVAATIAKDIDACINVLRFAGGSGSVPAGLRSESQYMTDASNIIPNVPVGITVRNDRLGRIEAAFRSAIQQVGFQSGGTNARYILVVEAVAVPAEFPNNPQKFTRIDITGNLTDTTTRAVLLPYNFTLREGHATQAEADNRAYAQAENKIKSEYTDILNTFLSELLPSR